MCLLKQLSLPMNTFIPNNHRNSQVKGSFSQETQLRLKMELHICALMLYAQVSIYRCRTFKHPRSWQTLPFLQAQQEERGRRKRREQHNWPWGLIRCQPPQQASGVDHTHLLGIKIHHFCIIIPDMFHNFYLCILLDSKAWETEMRQDPASQASPCVCGVRAAAHKALIKGAGAHFSFEKCK